MEQEKQGKTPDAFEAQMEVLRFLSESTDDYLFSWEFPEDRIYFAGPVWKRYAIMDPGQSSCSLQDWCSVVYEKDLPALREEFELIRQGQKIEHNMEYRLVDREGNRVWISCRGRCQIDRESCPVRMSGRISDTALAGKVDMLTGAFNAGKLTEDIAGIL